CRGHPILHDDTAPAEFRVRLVSGCVLRDLLLPHQPRLSCSTQIMTQRRRADQLLVERGLFASRTQAQAAIAAGLVTADAVVVSKPSAEIPVDAAIEATPAHPWVSRGGVKLAAALDQSQISVAGKVCLDVGASTGGFSQVLLARGA